MFLVDKFSITFLYLFHFFLFHCALALYWSWWILFTKTTVGKLYYFAGKISRKIWCCMCHFAKKLNQTGCPSIKSLKFAVTGKPLLPESCGQRASAYQRPRCSQEHFLVRRWMMLLEKITFTKMFWEQFGNKEIKTSWVKFLTWLQKC